MKFARSGYTQTEEYIILTNESLNFNPNMVILFFFPGNDISDINKKTAPDTMRPFFILSENEELILDNSFIKTKEYQFKKYINIFKNHSAIISLLSERYNLYKKIKQKIK